MHGMYNIKCRGFNGIVIVMYTANSNPWRLKLLICVLSLTSGLRYFSGRLACTTIDFCRQCTWCP